MSHWLFLIFFAMPAAAIAQVVPDTTDWHQYFPLEVGNRWQFQPTQNDQVVDPFGYEIVADTLVGDQAYFILRECEIDGGVPRCWRPPPARFRHFVRYDEANRMIVEWVSGPVPAERRWSSTVPCALDAPFGATGVRCRPEDTGTAYSLVLGGYGHDVAVASDTVRGVAVKQYIGANGRDDVAAGLGQVYRVYCVFILGNEWCFANRLHYARIEGVVYGMPLFNFPTTTATEGLPPAAALNLSIAPNPVRTSARARLSVPGHAAVAVAVYDLLGRVALHVYDGQLSAGHHVLIVDASMLPPGLYVVRAAAGRWTASSLLVVAR